jgi:hypothetical protein
VEEFANALSAKPFGLMLEALDDLHTNEIYISTGSSPRNALWGELMSVRAFKFFRYGFAVSSASSDGIRLDRLVLGEPGHRELRSLE